MSKRSQCYSIVVLELRPIRKRSSVEHFISIRASRNGSSFNEAEAQLNLDIEASESGRRNLIGLHRLRATTVYSKTTMLQPAADVLKAIYAKVGQAVDVPLDGVFELTTEESIEIIDTALTEYARKVRSKNRRRLAAEKARRTLKQRKENLFPDIRQAVLQPASHTEELCDALDGVHGKRLQQWASREIQRHQERIASAKRIRERTVDSAKAFEGSLLKLYELQEEINSLTDDDFLTVDEELEVEELEDQLESSFGALSDWRDGLPSELHRSADLVIEAVRDGRVRWEPLERAAQIVLIEDWDDEDRWGES